MNTLKKLLATAAVIGALAVPAHATEAMPQEFHGAWCYKSDNGANGTLPNGFNNKVETLYKTTGHNRTDIHCNTDHEFTFVNRKGWSGIESSCDIASKAIVGTEDGRPVYEISFKNCGGEAFTWNEAWRAYVDKGGFLHIRQKVTNFKEE